MALTRKNLPVVFAIFFVSLFSACTKESEDSWMPVQAKVENEFMGILATFPQGGYKNLVIRDASDGRIVLGLPQLNKKRIIMLPKGSYEFSADNAVKAILVLDDDCIINYTSRTFNIKSFDKPPAIAFRSGQQGWDRRSPLTEGNQYYLTILDLDNLDGLSSAYNAEIIGKGNVTLSSNKENNRIISDSGMAFTRGTYTVTVSGGSLGTINYNFKVEPLPPFDLAINNKWNGKNLEYADIVAYKSSDSLPAVIPRNDDGSGKISFTAFDYANTANVIRINEERFLSTGETGKIIFPKVNDDDRIILFVLGVNNNDDVYTYSFTSKRNENPKTISWDKIPTKGKNFYIEIPVDKNSLQDWDGIDNFSVSFFYKLGKPATIPNQMALSGNGGFIEIKNIGYRRQTDDSITCFVDLPNVSKASHFNYLVRVQDAVEGIFIMNNTSDENSQVPQSLHKQDN
jgi:hypothetical protein